MPILKFNKGPLAGQQVEIDREMILGREGDLAIPDSEMSRLHVKVRPLADGLEVEDLGSTNGTWIDGTQVFAPTRLAGGAKLEMGESVALLECDWIGQQTTTGAPTGHLGARFDSSDVAPRPSAAMGYRQSPATRLVGAQVATYLVIFTVAIVLVLYFAMR